MLTSENKFDLLFNEREIFRLINLYDQAINRRDFNLFSTLWTEDAVWETSKPQPAEAHGREQVIAMAQRLLAPTRFFFRTTQSPVIEFHANGQSATGQAGTIEVGELGNGNSYASVAIYSDEFRKVNATWLFSVRRFEYVWLETELPMRGTYISHSSGS